MSRTPPLIRTQGRGPRWGSCLPVWSPMNLREAAYPSHYPPIHSPGIRLYRTSVRQPTPPSTYHSTAGWVDFALFSNFMKSQGLGASLSTIWGTTKFFWLLFKNQWELPLLRYFQKNPGDKKLKIKKFCWEKYFLAYIILKKIKS